LLVVLSPKFQLQVYPPEPPDAEAVYVTVRGALHDEVFAFIETLGLE
jgi:hypothetical protein